MPVFAAIAAFVVAVVRKPIEPALKRRYAGPLAVVAGAAIVVAVWLRFCPDEIAFAYLVG